MIRTAAFAASLAMLGLAASAASAQDVTRSYHAPDAPIATSADVPSGFATLYLSGTTGDPLTPAANGAPATWGDTEQQTDSALTKLEAALQARGYGPGDVVKMTVFLVGDPAKGGVMDFAGMMAAYRRHYGTAAQPNRPARTTVQVVALAGPGALVEIEAVAAKRPTP